MTRLLPLILAAALSVLVAAPAAQATHPQPPLDITKMDYSPIGHFKPGEAVPTNAGTACDQLLKPLMNGKKFNPSGKFNAYDNNVFEVLCLPYRQSDDQSNTDPYGNNGDPRHGFCGGVRDPQTRPGNQAYQTGTCPNHQLEYVEYVEETLQEILKPLGGTTKRYEFSIDAGSTPVLTNTNSGKTINVAGVVPGSDHPDEQIIVGAHYDQTNDGPASAWDSAEGHATILRIAKIMADYWISTGTRPAATVKFIPWDAEESGSLGSADYVENNIVPGQENKVRSYWNDDPCAGGYPAFRNGVPAERINLGIQVANPGFINEGDPGRVEAFNQTVQPLVEQVFDQLDDKLESMPNQPEIFISTAEGEGQGDIGPGRDVIIDDNDPILFGSDWVNFIQVGIPFFNPGPEITGPNSENDALTPTTNPDDLGNPDGVFTFHTPNDNLPTMNRMTGSPTGYEWSEGWMKGMEMCAHLLGWGMLQHNTGGGAQLANLDPVAYYEALPNEAQAGKLVTFDASGSYQYVNAAARTFVPEANLQFKWELGDGKVFYGKKVRHAYGRTGIYRSRLTVTNRETRQSDTMTIPITVVANEDGQTDRDPAGQENDPGFPSQGTVVACQSQTGAFESARASRSGATGLKLQAKTSGPVGAEIFRVAKSGKAKRVAAFAFENERVYKGKAIKRKGEYFVRLSAKRGSFTQTRSFTFRSTGKKIALGRPFEREGSCELVSVFKLSSPVFSKKFTAGVAVTQQATVTVTVTKGKKRVARVVRRIGQPNRFQRITLRPKKPKKGTYKVTLKADAGDGKPVTHVLYVKKL